MARPTNDAKSHKVTVRLNEEAYEKIKGENMSEIVRNILCGDNVGQNNSFDGQNNDYVGQDLNLSDEDYEIVRETIDMIQKSRDKDGELIDASAFLKDFHDKLESGEYDLSSGKLRLGFHEVFEVLNTSEVKKWLKPVWNACEEKGRPYTDGLRAVFKHGAKLATEDLYGDRQ